MKSRSLYHRFLPALVAKIFVGGLFASAARAGTIIWGGPTWDPITESGYMTGFRALPPYHNTGDGMTAGFAERYDAGSYQYRSAVRWDASGSPPVELEGLTLNADSVAFGVNAAGTAVGAAQRFYAGSGYLVSRAVRWDASGSVATQLESLGTDGNGLPASATAFGISNAGTVVGLSRKYESGVDKGDRAVRWNASGTAVTELGHLGLSSTGTTSNYAHDVNDAGTAVGIVLKYVAGVYKGERAVRWDASSAVATELGNLGVNSNGETSTHVNAVNAAGTSAGWAWKSSNTDLRAVRWDASGTAATELGNLGTDSMGRTTAYAYDINDTGAAVGMAVKYDDAGNIIRPRPVRWDPSSTAAIELGLLGTDTQYGFREGHADAINAAGIAVGSVLYYDSNHTPNERAVAWRPDGTVIDLNTLVDPSSGWLRLMTVYGISDTNWVTGFGAYQPEFGDYYSRPFLLDISSVVPEPVGPSIIVLAAPTLLRRRKRITTHL